MRPLCPCGYARELPRDVLQVPGAHDVVPVEHRARLVPGDGHRHALDDAGVDHVPDRGAPEVVPEHPRRSNLLTGRPPRPAEVAPLRAQDGATWTLSGARVVPLQVREQEGDHTAELALERLHAGHLAGENVASSGVRYTSRPSSFFVMPGSRRSGSRLEVELPALEREDLALTAPSTGVLDRDGDLEVLFAEGLRQPWKHQPFQHLCHPLAECADDSSAVLHRPPLARNGPVLLRHQRDLDLVSAPLHPRRDTPRVPPFGSGGGGIRA